MRSEAGAGPPGELRCASARPCAGTARVRRCGAAPLFPPLGAPRLFPPLGSGVNAPWANQGPRWGLTSRGDSHHWLGSGREGRNLGFFFSGLVLFGVLPLPPSPPK